jgi:hypothetical protein
MTKAERSLCGCYPFSYGDLRAAIAEAAKGEVAYVNRASNRFANRLLVALEDLWPCIKDQFEVAEILEMDEESLILGPAGAGHNFVMADLIVSQLPEVWEATIPINARNWSPNQGEANAI